MELFTLIVINIVTAVALYILFSVRFSLSVDKIVAYLRDTILLMRIGMRQSKHELLRHANTLTILEGLLA